MKHAHCRCGSEARLPSARSRSPIRTPSGTHPAATVVRDSSSVVEHKLYWAQLATLEEAHYLCGLLNSEAAIPVAGSVGRQGLRQICVQCADTALQRSPSTALRVAWRNWRLTCWTARDGGGLPTGARAPCPDGARPRTTGIAADWRIAPADPEAVPDWLVVGLEVPPLEARSRRSLVWINRRSEEGAWRARSSPRWPSCAPTTRPTPCSPWPARANASSRPRTPASNNSPSTATTTISPDNIT